MTIRSLRISRIAIVILAALTVLVSLAIVIGKGIWHPTFALEAVWYLFWVVVFVAIPPFRVMMARLPGVYQLALLALGLALLSGQFLGGGRQTYPFVRWAMYNDPVLEARVAIYEGITASGDRVLLRPMSLVPSMRNNRLTSRLRFSYEAAAASVPDGSISDGSTEFDKLLQSLARVYNEANPAHSIVTVEVVSYRTPTGSYLDRSQHRQTVLWRTEV